MTQFLHRIRHFMASNDGPAAVEYAVLLAFIITVLFTVVASLGTTVSGSFSTVSSTYASAAS